MSSFGDDPRRAAFKPRASLASSQEKRRAAALARQQSRRAERVELSRRYVDRPPAAAPAAAAAADADASDEGRKARRGAQVRTKRLAARRRWSAAVSTPEWLLEPPADLGRGRGSTTGEGWLVAPRPEGKRCLVVASHGKTRATTLHGAVLHEWRSALPGGGRRYGGGGGGGADAYTVLDCVYHEVDKTYYVLDMFAWGGHSLYDCTAEFRSYWIRTKLEERREALDDGKPGSVRAVPCFEADAAGLAQCHAAAVPFVRDGLLFYLKAGHVELGVTATVLLWKDASTTRYLHGHVGDRQSIVLEVGLPPQPADEGEDEGEGAGAGTDAPPAAAAPPATAAQPLCTSDGVALGEMGAAELAARKLAVGDLARFTIDAATAEQGVAGLAFAKACSPSRPAADSWSKILFSCAVRGGAACGAPALAALLAAGGDGMAT